MIQKIRLNKPFKVKIFDDSGRPFAVIKDNSPRGIKKKFNSIFDKFM